MAHPLTEQHRPLVERRQPVPRPVELARHAHRIVVAIVPENPEVGVPEDLLAGLEVDPIPANGHPGALAALLRDPVVVHANLASIPIDVYVRGCDVVRLMGVGEKRVLQVQHAGAVGGPGPLEIVGVGHADVLSLVVRKVQVVGPQGLRKPVGYADQRGSVYVSPDPVVQLRGDNRVRREAFDSQDKLPACRVEASGRHREGIWPNGQPSPPSFLLRRSHSNAYLIELGRPLLRID